MDSNDNHGIKTQVHALKSYREKIKTTLDIISTHESSSQGIESMLAPSILTAFREDPNRLKADYSKILSRIDNVIFRLQCGNANVGS